VRDESLAKLGIRVEDSPFRNRSSTWIKEDPQILLQRISDKKAEKERKLKEKEKAKLLAEKKKSTPPKDWYITFESHKYSKFNTEGIPTHNTDGTPLPKSKINGLKKQMKAKERKYQKYLNSFKK